MGSPTAPIDALTAYEAMIRTVISPGMRSLGFTGSGGRYMLPDDDAWLLVGLQRSMHNSRDDVRFTVNATVIGKRAWQEARAESPYLPERPGPTFHYGHGFWHARLGKLMPLDRDMWWHVTARTNAARLGADVVVAIREYALPAIDQERARVLQPAP